MDILQACAKPSIYFKLKKVLLVENVIKYDPTGLFMSHSATDFISSSEPLYLYGFGHGQVITSIVLCGM